MRKIFALATPLALLACTAQPAMANEFGGVYGQLTAGLDDVTNSPDTNEVVYGAAVGVNIPIERAIVGVEASASNVFEDTREIGASARLGYTFDDVMLYGKVGYANYQDVFSQKLDGLRLGGGVEYNLSDITFVSAEYRYTDFEQNVGKHAGLVGLGLRF